MDEEKIFTEAESKMEKTLSTLKSDLK